ncbi:YciI family protein [Jiangella muralis]|uniref:YciI family protein n=1 Tax=Jiangella muralis TaxID=702383 RepID=UPI00069F2FAA
MRYLLLISADEEREPDIADGDGRRRFDAWMADLERRGVLRAHEGLHPSRTATTVRVRDGDVLRTDGPFMETKDQIGGFAVIECADLDEAVEIAAGHPAARFGQVEIRPLR